MNGKKNPSIKESDGMLSSSFRRFVNYLFHLSSADIITIFLSTLCVLAASDLWRQYAINTTESMFEHYSKGTIHSEMTWKMGYRLEDLSYKLSHTIHRIIDFNNYYNSHYFYKNLRKKSKSNLQDIINMRMSRLHLSHIDTITDNKTFSFLNHIQTNTSLINSTSVYQLFCANKDRAYLRIGYNDFQTYEHEQCRIFYEATTDKQYPYPGDKPNTMFQSVALSNDGAFGFRSIYNGYFLSVVPPPFVFDKQKSAGPWKVVLAGPTAGAAEMFRFTEEGYLYSAIAQGFVRCADSFIVSILQPETDEPYKSYRTTPTHAIKLRPVSYEELQDALSLVNLSDQLRAIYTNDSTHHLAANRISRMRKKILSSSISSASSSFSLSNNTTKICIGIPMTSTGTLMRSVVQSPFWSNFFDTFMSSIDWQANTYVFRIYLGFDRADDLYDTGDAWADMRTEFARRATFRMKEQLMKEEEISSVLANVLSIKLMHFDHLKGSPSQIVSQLMLQAYGDGFDYFYQVNDDTSIRTANWATALIGALANNPLVSNLGVTGPTDSNNEKIFTHSFVHRTHIDIFGHYFPPTFKNWWSDDWISSVYGQHTIRVPSVIIDHKFKSQKSRGTQRYTVDSAASMKLPGEIIRGMAAIDTWLKNKNLPRLQLSSVCGFIPSVNLVRKALKTKKLVNNETMQTMQ